MQAGKAPRTAASAAAHGGATGTDEECRARQIWVLADSLLEGAAPGSAHLSPAERQGKLREILTHLQAYSSPGNPQMNLSRGWARIAPLLVELMLGEAGALARELEPPSEEDVADALLKPNPELPQLTIDIVEAVAQRHPRVLRVGFGTQDAPLQIAAAMIEYVVLEAARDPMGTLWRAGA
ncbi:hypothetical protein C2E20_3883 [Micractinium conductrix]|uniref:Uncharacterized protein n=1 Tax=Micractinium conductrix TaxID=554055 RepID=A0A2P6VFP5_9CHLO|nr:hypothetical protein C2E20_3883 [Micractinium conductrix]|eukprot:PSC72891.1 hypothetical protein C2E20_3883 [Micractinium conductrix]